MCARYNTFTRGGDIGRWGLSWASPELSETRAEMFPRYLGPVIRWRDGELGLDAMTWTLVPFWSKELDWKKVRHNFNARAETADALASFRTPFRSRRCLVPAECFTEFPVIDGSKVRHRIASADGGPLLFAGLWDHWTARDGSAELRTFTILTTESHDGLRWLHHRMPVALTTEAQEEWLDPRTPPERAKALLVSPLPTAIDTRPE